MLKKLVERLAGVLLGCAAVLATSAAEAIEDFPLPPATQLESVGEHMRINGVEVEVNRFVSALSPEDIVAFYAEHWNEGSPRTTQHTHGWSVVGHQARDRHLTAQVRARRDGGSEGFLSTSDTRHRPSTPRRAPLALPIATRTLSVVESYEGDYVSTITTSRSRLGAANAERWLRMSGQLRGFQIDPFFDAAPSSTAARATFMRRADEELTAVIQPDAHGSLIVLHHLQRRGSSK